MGRDGKDLLEGTHVLARSVLIVEDEYLIADDLRQILNQAGFEVLGPVSKTDHAIELANACRPDAAIIDINLGPGPDFSLATWLARLGVPFVFSTGYDPRILPEELVSVPMLEKPFNSRNVLQMISSLTSPVPA